MPECEVCGNDYDKAMEIRRGGDTHVFDSFECAIHALAPECGHCGVKIAGHGVEANGSTYCARTAPSARASPRRATGWAEHAAERSQEGHQARPAVRARQAEPEGAGQLRGPRRGDRRTHRQDNEAKQLSIEGRSSMSKRQLQRAVDAKKS